MTELKIKVRVGNEEYIEPPDLSSSSTLCQQQATKNDKQTQHTDEKAIIDCKSVQTSFIGEKKKHFKELFNLLFENLNFSAIIHIYSAYRVNPTGCSFYCF